MVWTPIGPDFVFTPRDEAFKRLSRRNAYGRQGLVQGIAIDPTDQSTIYVTERPSSGGTSAFRTRDDGKSWFPIADALQQANPNVDPSCVAINPDHPEIVYLGTYWNQGVYVSSNRGELGSWSARAAVTGGVRRIVVDSRTSANSATTVLYAATTSGVQRSADGGASWSQIITGDVWTLSASTPAAGTAHFYAGIYQSGVWHATNPATAAGWTNLSAAGIGLPAYAPAAGMTPETFQVVLVDHCPRNATRAYAWLLRDGTSLSLYTTGNPTGSWSLVAATPPPGPWYGFYAMSFGVASSSPGDGATDVILAGNGVMARSIDAGQTWQNDAVFYHADQHAIAFWPANPAAGTIATTYIGNDGGLAKSSKFADPAYAIQTAPTTFNQGELLVDSAAWQNLNAGKQSSAVYQYASDRRLPAIGYIGCQDTGLQGGTGALGWRGIADADGGQVATAPGPTGVIVWGTMAQYGGWASYRLALWNDHGEANPPINAFCTLSGSLLSPRSPLVVGLDDRCLAGVVAQDLSTTMAEAITSSAAGQSVRPASMTGIVVGSVLTLDQGVAGAEETVTVTNTTPVRFTAVFNRNHALNAAVVLNRDLVVRIDQSGSGTAISQDFVANGAVNYIAVHPSDPNILYCVTGDQRVWRTTSGSTAGPATVWTEISTNRPAGVQIHAVAVNSAGEAFAIVEPIASGAATTPIFLVSGGSWQAQPSSGHPAGGFGRGLADPVQADVLYVVNGARVFRATRAGGSWSFVDISAGLPGGWIYDLWVGNAGTGPAPKVLLRAAIPTRAVWELDVTAGAATPTIELYVRDNLLDVGYLNPSPEGIANPYDPTRTVTHYQCEDLKIDARQRHAVSGGTDFQQTDPEGLPIPPMSHVLFDVLKDNSQNLPQADDALVHVQVHNRAATPSGSVRVWAIYCNASAGVPSLAASVSQGNAFPFWNQFGAGGTIAPNLPADSPWRSVGAPVTLSGIDAAHPQVASWSWTVPTLATGDIGHYCMAVFIHSGAAPINESGLSVDAIAPTNRQIGQKNLHIGPPLPPGPGPAPGGPRGGGGGPAPMREYIEFHNPTGAEQRADFRFDFSALPAALQAKFALTPIKTVGPLHDAMSGVAESRPARPAELPRSPVFPLGWPKMPSGPNLIAWLGWLITVLRLLWCTLVNVIRRLIGKPTQVCAPPGMPIVPLPTFEPVIHVAQPSAVVAIRGVALAPFERVAAYLGLEPIADLPPGEQLSFEIQQRFVDRETETEYLGGGTYLMNVDGEPKARRKPVFAPSVDPDTPLDVRQRIERDGERLREKVLPSWIHGPMERSRQESPKDIGEEDDTP
jgi:hypothetical protein